MNTACDCQKHPPASVSSYVALSTTSSHVQRKLRHALKPLSHLWHEEEEIFYLRTAEWPVLLEKLLDSWTSAETARLLAAPLPAEGSTAPLGWSARPIEHMLLYAATPWFPTLLNDNTLFPYFQPIVQLEDGAIFGYEALIRARHNERLISAGELIAAANAHQAIWNFDQEARTAAICQGIPQLESTQKLFVNFTPTVVYDPETCLETSWAATRRVNATLGQLIFEVVETERFPDLGLLKAILDEYRRMGALVALDDLGAGFTSLSFLAKLRPDVVKLDKELIAGISLRDPRSRLVQALIEYAHDLNIMVVAEGLESSDELFVLRELGADLGQGYFLGRPAPTPQPVSPEGLAALQPGSIVRSR